MKSINKNIVLFSGIIVLIGLAVVSLSEKLPRLLTHDTYYCQSTFFSLLTPIPSQLLLLPFIIMSILTIYAVVKLVIISIRTYILKKELIKHIEENRKFNNTIKKLKLEDKTSLIFSPNPFAFCLGILNPKIFISTALLNTVTQKELETILYHEQYHLNNRDSLTMVIAWFSKVLFPFLPIISDFLKNYRIEREVKADKEAISRTGTKNYVVSVLRKFLKNPSPQIAFSPAIFEHDTFEPRINALINKKNTKLSNYNFKNISISFAFLFIIAFALVGPVHAMHIHNEDSHIIMLHSTEDVCLDWRNNHDVQH